MSGADRTSGERKLSIIIPCYNEPVTIGEIVRRATQAELPSGWSREIIVVDDGSRDDTKRGGQPL